MRTLGVNLKSYWKKQILHNHISFLKCIFEYIRKCRNEILRNVELCFDIGCFRYGNHSVIKRSVWFNRIITTSQRTVAVPYRWIILQLLPARGNLSLHSKRDTFSMWCKQWNVLCAVTIANGVYKYPLIAIVCNWLH